MLLFMRQWTYNSTCRPLSYSSIHITYIRAQFDKWLVKTGLTSCSFILQGDSCIVCRAALFIIKLDTQPSHCIFDIFGLSKEVKTWQWFNLGGQLLPYTGSGPASFQAILCLLGMFTDLAGTLSMTRAQLPLHSVQKYMLMQWLLWYRRVHSHGWTGDRASQPDNQSSLSSGTTVQVMIYLQCNKLTSVCSKKTADCLLD